jgi:RimJ/RimL family protein N-acetyltransferase
MIPMLTQPSDPRPYIIKGEKVGLKTFRKEDIDTVTPWFSDPEFLLCLTSSGIPMSRANEEEFYDQHLKNTDKSIQFAIFALADATTPERHIGNCGLFSFNRHNHASFGIGIGDRTAWGHGYGTEATRLVAEYGFFFLNLYSIRLWAYSFNQRAIRAYEKAGYKHAGRIRGALCVAGERFDEVMMDITRDDVDLSRMRALVPLLGAD